MTKADSGRAASLKMERYDQAPNASGREYFAIKRWVSILFAGVLCCQNTQALTIHLVHDNFGVFLRFNGNDSAGGIGTFEFQRSAFGNLIVTDSDGAGDSFAAKGNIDGLFTIGSITAEGPRQTAPVYGDGLLRLTDRMGQELTAHLEWVDIFTPGTHGDGSINASGEFNLRDIRYAGTGADFSELVAAGTASIRVGFQFLPPKNLEFFTMDGRIETPPFVVEITTVPEPGITVLAGFGLTGLLVFSRRRRRRPDRDIPA